MRSIFKYLAIIFSFLITALPAYCSPLDGNSSDLVLKALKDEVAADIKDFKEDKNNAPYFICFRVFDYTNMRLSASSGALVQNEHEHTRKLLVDFRVGDYSLDNANFVGANNNVTSVNWGELTVDNNYNAIRHALRSSAEIAYKAAIKNL